MLVSNETPAHVRPECNPLVHDYPNPLKIVVIGAGISGLSAAIALRSQGHNVEVYENSSGDKETCSAVCLTPNSNGLLRRWGIFVDNFGANEISGLAESAFTGGEKRITDLTNLNKMWQHPWHSVDANLLRSRLEEVATTEDGPTSPAVLHTSAMVANIDSEAGRIILADGSSINADVIVGADGVDSKTRESIDGGRTRPVGSGEAAVSFFISRKELLQDPITRSLGNLQNTISTWYGNDRRIFIYPFNNNETLNVVLIYPENEVHATLSNQENKASSINQVLELYQDCNSEIKQLVSKGDSAELKFWNLLDMDELPSWVKGKSTLVGDSAHPFAPYHGEGVGQAMEDAAALAVVLPRGTAPIDVPERLKLYEKIRRNRAYRLQAHCRQIGQSWIGGKLTTDTNSYTNYNFGHDEFDHSSVIFKKWLWSQKRDIYWRMPIAFGPSPGPRQDAFGRPHGGHHERTFVTICIMFKTSKTYLESLFPTESFSFKSSATIAYASIYVTTLGNMSWLGGGGYTHCGLYIHDVEYTKRDGTRVYGTYLPVLFENLADPIISGRDELGMNKVYCDIDIDRKTDSCHVQCLWRGTKFIDIKLGELKSNPPHIEGLPADAAKDYGVLTYKYIPATGEPGKADVEYACVIPHADEARVAKPTVRSVAWSHKSDLKFDAKDWDSLPTIHHISSTLAAMPVYKIIFAKIEEGSGVGDMSSCRRIE